MYDKVRVLAGRCGELITWECARVWWLGREGSWGSFHAMTP